MKVLGAPASGAAGLMSITGGIRSQRVQLGIDQALACGVLLLVQQAIHAEPHQASYHAWLAEVLSLLGNFPEAVRKIDSHDTNRLDLAIDPMACIAIRSL